MEIKIKNRDGNELAAVLTRPEDSDNLVVMVHGFHSSKDSNTFRALEALLAEANIGTLRYDMFGHGESYGELSEMSIRKNVDDFLDVLYFVDDLKWTNQIACLGSSFGGLILTLGLAEYPGNITCVGLKAPAINWGMNWETKIEGGLDEWRKNGYIEYSSKANNYNGRMNYGVYEELMSLDGFTAAERIRSPALIIQGTDDASVPIEDTRKLNEAIPLSSLIEMPGDDHQLIHSFEDVMYKFRDWFVEHLK